MIPRWLALAILAACGESRPQAEGPGSTTSACSSLAAPQPNQRRLFIIAAQQQLQTACIPPGGWDLIVGGGPRYKPDLKNCTKAIFDAAKATIDPSKLTRQIQRSDWMLVHFLGPNPQYYEISYSWNEFDRLAMLSLVNISNTGNELSPEGNLEALKTELEKAFYCN
jgi:hypothetical protein